MEWFFIAAGFFGRVAGGGIFDGTRQFVNSLPGRPQHQRKKQTLRRRRPPRIFQNATWFVLSHRRGRFWARGNGVF